MRRVSKTFLVGASIAAVVLAVGGCPKGGVPGAPSIPGQGAKNVDPNACGGFGTSDAGKKIKAFLQATNDLNKAVMDTEVSVKTACNVMGTELGMTGLDGSTKDTCNKVIAELKNHMKLGLKAEAKLDINYEPAVCEVNADLAASAAAKCEGKASAEMAVQCNGSCSGTCKGQCDGTCSGAAGTGGSGGECDGQCSGTCSGSCSGGCSGHADVSASAECEAHAEVKANISAKCTEPKLDVNYDASLVLDKSKVEAAVAAIKAGMPKMLMLSVKINGPLKGAVMTWVTSAQKLKGAAGELSKAFKSEAMCVSGQLAAAAAMVAQINMSIEVQVEVSASASGSIGG